jgi:hypothetical protein
MAWLRGWWRRNWLPLLFLLCALPTGLGVVMLTPIGEAPDESQHIARADGLLYGDIIGHKEGAYAAGVTMNIGIFSIANAEIYSTLPAKPLPAAVHAQARAIPWTKATLFCSTQMVQYFPAFYLPGAAGLLAGQLAGMRPLYTVFLARAAMLLSFLVMGAAALHLARFGRPFLFCVLSLPLTIFLGACMNEDGQLIAAAVLAIALLTRAGPRLDWRWLFALLLLTLIACSKAPYIGLIGACLVPLTWETFRRRVGMVAVAAMLPLVWMGLMLHLSFSPYPRPAYHPGPLWPGSRDIWLKAVSVQDNLAVLRAHPAQVILLPLNSAWSHWAFIWPRMIGAIGWSQLPISQWQYTGWLVALAVAALGTAAGEQGGWRPLDAGLILFLMFSAFIGIELSMYLSFTDVGAPSIEGVNGRYFLLFLPFIVVALPRLGGRLGIARIPAPVFSLPAIIMAVLDIHALPAQIFHVFQMSGP